MKKYSAFLIGAIAVAGFCKAPVFHGFSNQLFYAVYSQKMVRDFQIYGVYTAKLPENLFSIYKMKYPDFNQCGLCFSMTKGYFNGNPKNIELLFNETGGKNYRYSLSDSKLGDNPKLNYVGFTIPCNTSFKNTKSVNILYQSGNQNDTKNLPLKALKRVWYMKKESPPVQGGNFKFISMTLTHYD
ncbi:MAG: hypothetical protein COV52_09170 [Gammaproteobacteria bacterium CG11_big_fil_rev_8_21_14_0_20_46_22]|nr:MAG: hypothetical protein COW05_01785 [Gammaproteobacteria bacterium CG12_big_fil_rev_8_21_14_0_65_46_12]PIR10448.1 MAG: hypothetical protein COV52_09170 [Gammaproteobacteria bacterium CG11_big_fil_rev_8_21_14_0_20_46_22]